MGGGEGGGGGGGGDIRIAGLPSAATETKPLRQAERRDSQKLDASRALWRGHPDEGQLLLGPGTEVGVDHGAHQVLPHDARAVRHAGRQQGLRLRRYRVQPRQQQAVKVHAGGQTHCPGKRSEEGQSYCKNDRIH